MSNFTPLSVSANDSRLSSPEAAAPNANAVSSALQARRQKLRRIVAWVVGGATLLMCIGLVRAAVRSHADHEAEVAAAPSPQAPVVPPAPAVALAAPEPSATQAAVAPAEAASVASPTTKKPNATAGHTAKPLAKNAKRTTLAKSAGTRH